MSETSTTTSGNWLHTSVPKEFSDRTPHFWIMESRTLLYNSVDDNDLLSGSDFSLQEWIPCVGWSPSGRVPVACFFLQWLWNVRATAPPCCTHVCISYHEPLVLEEWYHCWVSEISCWSTWRKIRSGIMHQGQSHMSGLFLQYVSELFARIWCMFFGDSTRSHWDAGVVTIFCL